MTETQAVLAANQAFYRAFEKKDIEAMGQVWSKGVDSLCIHPGRDTLKGWEPIRASWVQIFKNTNYIEIETEIIRIEVNDSLAYVVLIENLLQVFRNQRTEAKTIATNIFERMGEGWYLIHHHGSPILR
ncbi:nuclear transport factor 2 family protein [Phormidium tenue FACHB-886]|nr:nuclear transport factor 2 family protein [Phormidium tenue FACHB-886]